jgi:hypothetical protein
MNKTKMRLLPNHNKLKSCWIKKFSPSTKMSPGQTWKNEFKYFVVCLPPHLFNVSQGNLSICNSLVKVSIFLIPGNLAESISQILNLEELPIFFHVTTLTVAKYLENGIISSIILGSILVKNHLNAQLTVVI